MNTCTLDQCELKKEYIMHTCALEKEQRDLLFFMGFREGDRFTVLATSKTGSIVSPQGINTRLALSPRHTSKMYATRSVETDQANC
jgi:Fe2+ transport system protein FeoA